MRGKGLAPGVETELRPTGACAAGHRRGLQTTPTVVCGDRDRGRCWPSGAHPAGQAPFQGLTGSN